MNIEQIVIDLMTNIRVNLRDQLAAQGHVLTGNLSKSIIFEVEAGPKEVVGHMLAEDYGVFVDVGVKASRIPFGGRGRGGGGKSAYIQGLITFWENRGLSGRDAIGAAFATAQVHAREGMPSRGSYAHTSTGERTGFVRAAIEAQLSGMQATIENRVGESFFFELKTGADNAKIIFTQ